MKRGFAASFVITAALACTKESEAPAPEPRTRNPPGPAVTWAPDPAHPDQLVPSVREVVKAHSTVKLLPDLTCMEYFRDDCEPGVKCNPPEPAVVPCPPELAPRPAPK